MEVPGGFPDGNKRAGSRGEVTQRRASGPCSRLGRNFARARANNAVPQSSRSSPSLSKRYLPRSPRRRDESPSSTHRSWIIPSLGRARSRYSGAPKASFAFISSFRRALRRRSLTAQRATMPAASSACPSSASLLRGSPAADPLPRTNTPSRPHEKLGWRTIQARTPLSYWSGEMDPRRSLRTSGIRSAPPPLSTSETKMSKAREATNPRQTGPIAGRCNPKSGVIRLIAFFKSRVSAMCSHHSNKGLATALPFALNPQPRETVSCEASLPREELVRA